MRTKNVPFIGVLESFPCDIAHHIGIRVHLLKIKKGKGKAVPALLLFN
jgi:hypothetical protein